MAMLSCLNDSFVVDRLLLTMHDQLALAVASDDYGLRITEQLLVFVYFLIVCVSGCGPPRIDKPVSPLVHARQCLMASVHSGGVCWLTR